MNPNDRFTKSYDELIAAGLHPRLALLYGRLVFHAGKDGRCFPRHATLAKELGIKRRQVINLLNDLKALKLLEWTRGRYSNSYRPLNPDVQWIAHHMRNGVHISDVHRTAHIKEAAAKETGKRENPAPKPSPKAETPKPRSKPTPQLAADPSAKTGPSSFAAAANAALTPVEQFRVRCIERHGPRFDVDRCVTNVRRQLEKRGGVTFEDFVAYDAEETTSGRKTNPNGYYVHLAQQLRERVVQDAIHALDAVPNAPAPPEPPRNAKGRCEECNGAGVVLPGGEFCRCKLGRDLEAQARRKPITETKPPRTRNGAA